MTSAAKMLDAHARRCWVDTQVHGDTIDVLVEAERTARQCVDACLHQDQDLRSCISVALDTADVCSAASGVLSRLCEPSTAVAILRAARVALRSCAETCARHSATITACAVCSEVCSRAEEHCVRMEAAVGSRDPGAVTNRPGPMATTPEQRPDDLMSPGLHMGRSGAAPEPNEPA